MQLRCSIRRQGRQTSVEFAQNADGSLSAGVLIDDDDNSGAGTCNVRRISFISGISVATAKKQLKQVEVSYSNNGPKKKRR